MSFELFGTYNFPSQSGLPGPDYPHKEPSEEEWDESEKRAAKIEEARRTGTLDELRERWAAERSSLHVVPTASDIVAEMQSQGGM